MLLAVIPSCGGAPAPDTGTASQLLVSSCPFPSPATAIDFDKEMTIRDLSVVEDPCRNTWNTACPNATRAMWTFGHLMSVMSGTPSTNVEAMASNVTARQFVGNWVKYWLSNQTIGSDTVVKRDNFRTKLLNRWLTDSGCAAGSDPVACPLDLRMAPFRLLAVVNRIDMSGFDYSSGGSGTGELRFVFGAYDRNTNIGPITTIEAGAIIKAEAILEYRFPTTHPSSDWANRFHALGSQTFVATPTGVATTAFSDALQNTITNLVVEPNAQPGNPNNGSSIGQVRFAENAFDINTAPNTNTWEFRQFALTCTSGLCPLVQVAVSQTPPTSADPTNATYSMTPPTPTQVAINNFLVANQDAISRSRHVIPTSMLGGSSISKTGGAAELWTYPNPVTTPDPEWNALIRHNFAFGTCNGCHYLETANQLDIFHVKPRLKGARSDLSQFLLTSMASADGVLPNTYLQVPDPDTTSYDNDGNPIYFHYNEPWRRTCEVRRILTGSLVSFTTATGHGFEINLLAPPTTAVRHLTFPTTIPNTDAGTLLAPGTLKGFDFAGKVGGIVTITMNGAACSAPDTMLFLFGPKDASGNFGLITAQNDDSPQTCTLDSQIKSFHLPATGTYLIVATSFSQAGSGHFSLQLSCDNGIACTPP